jgi:hypothetical protein
MTNFRVAGSVAVVMTLALVAGCGRGERNGPAVPLPASFAADDLVLRVSFIGGFTTPANLVTRLPYISVYGDGRVLTEQIVPSMYPGPTLSRMDLRHIGETDIRRLLDLAVEAGAADGGRLDDPLVMDAATTRFTVLTGGGLKHTDVYALSMGDDPHDGPPVDREARTRLQDLQRALGDLPATLGRGAVGASSPYQPTRLAAIAEPWQDPGNTGLPEPPEAAWPGPALVGASLGTNLSCVIAADDQLGPVLSAAGRANTSTPWTYAGQRYTMWFRPLLPEESTCTDLQET